VTIDHGIERATSFLEAVRVSREELSGERAPERLEICSSEHHAEL
jgi:hypothetical protein